MRRTCSGSLLLNRQNPTILMATRPAGAFRALLSTGLLLVYVSLIAYRPLVWRGSWSFDAYDMFHWAGVVGAALFVVSTSMGLDALRVRLSTGWAGVHCPLGVLAFVFAAVHARTKAAVFLPVHTQACSYSPSWGS